ncbi:MAG: hypothetical protein WC700_04015 [Gemmatimonadaceae bacterium]|jgi:hypothetical protein
MDDSVGIDFSVAAAGRDFSRIRVVGREAARTPVRFRDRVVAQFRSPANLDYLRGALARATLAGPQRKFALDTLPDALYTFSERDGRAYDVLMSDPVAQRGRAVDFWAEVRRLNLAFIEERRAFLRDGAATVGQAERNGPGQSGPAARGAPRDGISEDDESYHMRMFISDSLRPPGLEHLNTPGPLWALREDQSTWTPRSAAQRRQTDRFAASAASGTPQLPQGGEKFSAVGSAEDSPWGVGDPNRTPEQALAEYWGDGWTTSETQTGAPETTGRAYGADYAWGTSWQENGGSRFMRYENIPFWQKGGREGYDHDIDETLGTQARELDAHVRRWNMDYVTAPRGQEYRKYGPRSGHVV